MFDVVEHKIGGSRQTVKLAVDPDVVVELLLATPPDWLVDVLYNIAARCVERSVKMVARSSGGRASKRNGVYHVTLDRDMDVDEFINRVDEEIFACIRRKIERRAKH